MTPNFKQHFDIYHVYDEHHLEWLIAFLSIQLGFQFMCGETSQKHFCDQDKSSPHTMKFYCIYGSKKMHDMIGTPIRDPGVEDHKFKKVK